MADLNLTVHDSSGLTDDAGNSGGLARNGNFESVPSFVAATTANNVWIDGTASGSSTDDSHIWGTQGKVGSTAAQFDSSTSNSGTYSLKVSTTATGSTVNINPFAGGVTPDNVKKYCVPLYPNTTYTCSAWLKTTVNSGAATTGARFNFILENGNASLLANNLTTAINSTTGWTKYTSSFGSGSSDPAGLFIWPQFKLVGNDGTATLVMDAWIDDIVILTTSGTHGSVSCDLDPVVTLGIQNKSGPKIWS
jgi:hypothetical protein